MGYLELNASHLMSAFHGTVSDTYLLTPSEYDFFWVEYRSEAAGDDGVFRAWYNTSGNRTTATLILEITTGNGG